MLWGYNKTYDENSVTDGRNIYFPHNDVPIPHVFFQFQGIKINGKSPPPELWLPLYKGVIPPDPEIGLNDLTILEDSLVDETGFINCTDLVKRFNADPRIFRRNLTITENVLPPDTLKFKFSVNNKTGNFNGDLSIVVKNIVVKKDETTKGYRKEDKDTSYTFFGNNFNLVTFYISIVNQNYYNLFGTKNTTFKADSLTRIYTGQFQDTKVLKDFHYYYAGL